MPSAHQTPPYESYAAIAGLFVGGIATVAAVARRAPAGSALDFLALSAATFKASRTLSRERVASFVRQPFVVDVVARRRRDERLPPGRLQGGLRQDERARGLFLASGLAHGRDERGRARSVCARPRRSRSHRS